MISILSYDKRVNCLVLWYPAVFPNETALKNRTETEEAVKELERMGFVTLKTGSGKKFRVGKKFIEEREETTLVPYAKKISCPTLVIHGDSDTTVPFEQSERLLEILKGPKKLEKISGAKHAWHSTVSEYDPKAQQKAIESTVEWVERWLK